MVGFVSSTTTTQLVGQLCQLALSDNPTQAALATTTTNAPTPSLEVNSVQTTNSSQPSSNKKKNNNCNKKKNSSTKQTDQTNSASNVGGNKGRRKFKYPCMVCQEDHMTKDCPRLLDIQNYIKQEKPSSQLAVLTNPFPTPQQMVAQAPAPASGKASSSSATILMTDVVVSLSTRANNYDPSEGRSTPDDIPSTSQPN